MDKRKEKGGKEKGKKINKMKRKIKKRGKRWKQLPSGALHSWLP